MPSETFHNLSSDKKEKLINYFLREFSVQPYDHASLTAVVKALGIAKGSIYQYFGGKQELFLYLAEHCYQIKQQYSAPVQRQNFPDFWTYFRAVSETGIQFDRERPLESNFLHALARNINSPSLKELHKKWLKEVIGGFCQLVEYEVQQGLFRKDLPVQTMGYYLYKFCLSFGDYMHSMHDVDIEARIQAGQSIYDEKNALLIMQVIDEFILLSRPAFENQYQ